MGTLTGDGVMTLLLGAALFFIGGTLLPLLSHDHWTVRLFDFPRLQMAGGGLLTLAGLVAAGPSSAVEYAVMVGLGLCLVDQIDRILPYTPLAPRQVRPAEKKQADRTLSLLVCNVEIENRDAQPVLDLIAEREPDLVLAVEADDWWAEQFRALQDRFPHTVEQPQDDAYGMLLYSRRPLSGTEVRFLVEDHVPSIHTQVTLPSGPSVHVHGLHPRPPHPTHDPDTTERDAELLHLARSIRNRDAPTVVIGDLNDVSWSYTTRLFQNISGLLDPRVGRGIYSTFHARYPLFRYPLDHTFHSAHFRLAALEVLPYVGSDHFPVYTELQYDPEAPEDHREPTADEVDEAQAQYEFDKLHEKRGDRPPDRSDR
ncbi:MAG: endonuclease/exonuclease/phosphatase family protein [Salinibacter sp.]